VIVPEGLEASEPTGNIHLKGYAEDTTSVTIVNRTALAGSRYPVFVAVEYDDGGVHQGIVAQGIVEIVAPRNFWEENQTLLIVGVGVLLALWLVLVLRRATSRALVPDRWLRVVRSLCDAVAVGAALYLIAGKFPTEVMFADTVTNGGDMGTHYYAAAYMRDVLLPKGAVTGWCPGNYCGFPLFQFYFCFPFLLIALCSHLIRSRSRSRSAPSPARSCCRSARTSACGSAARVPGAGARRARDAAVPLHGGELHVGRQHPVDARRRVRVLARLRVHGPLHGHPPPRGGAPPRLRVGRALGRDHRRHARLHAALGRPLLDVGARHDARLVASASARSPRSTASRSC
jgi:hypothetical protein